MCAFTIAGVGLLCRIRKGQSALGRLGLKDKTAPAIWNCHQDICTRTVNTNERRPLNGLAALIGTASYSNEMRISKLENRIQK
jgi:hypothetical protein